MLAIIKNENSKGQYFTLFNSTTGFHIHATSRADAKKILECASLIERNRPVTKMPSNIRVRAMKLYIGGKKL